MTPPNPLAKRGRPSLTTTTPSIRLEVRATAAQRLHLRRIADARGVRIAEVVRDAIDECIDRDPTRRRINLR